MGFDFMSNIILKNGSTIHLPSKVVGKLSSIDIVEGEYLRATVELTDAFQKELFTLHHPVAKQQTLFDRVVAIKNEVRFRILTAIEVLLGKHLCDVDNY